MTITTVKIGLKIDWSTGKAHITGDVYGGGNDPRLRSLMAEISCTIEESMRRILDDSREYDSVEELYARDNGQSHHGGETIDMIAHALSDHVSARS